MGAERSLAVVGAGWSGLAAAVEACSRGHRVTLFEMAREVGGRARSVALPDGRRFDNGQHILIGAYRETLALMQRVGVDPQLVLLRLPLELSYPDGHGLRLPPGRPLVAFTRGVLSARGWLLRERLQLLRTAFAWWRGGMRNPGVATVRELSAALPRSIRDELIDPLCIAALNTPSDQACATVFLRVLHDALFAARNGSDLLLPRAGLSGLMPTAATAWLRSRGAALRLGQRVSALQRLDAGRWRVDDEPFDAVVVACPAGEAARLVEPIDSNWSRSARGLRFEPIVTVFIERRGRPLRRPIVALRSGPDAPAQFAFDLGTLGVADSTLALVVSGASPWLDAGLDPLSDLVRRQALRCFADCFDSAGARILHVGAERRATFACTPALARPSAVIAPGLIAAGDYVAGPYPATLEGAVRSGIHAVRGL